MKNTLVFGASPNPERYAWRAVQALRRHGHPVLAVGGRTGLIGDVEIIKGHPDLAEIDTITLYIGPHLQPDHYEYLLELKPRRMIFNPGTENPVLEQLAQARGIEVVIGCTLVMLSIGTF